MEDTYAIKNLYVYFIVISDRSVVKVFGCCYWWCVVKKLLSYASINVTHPVGMMNLLFLVLFSFDYYFFPSFVVVVLRLILLFHDGLK